MSIDIHDYTQSDPRCRCRPVHGNADTDGICAFCRPKKDAAEAAYETALDAALSAYMAAVKAVRWTDDRERVLERLVDAATITFKQEGGAVDSCMLCGWTDGCKPDCAVERLREVID